MDKKSLIIIPARGGSKRLPKKNIRDFCGKPLINWTVMQACNVTFPKSVVVTSDCDKILDAVDSENGGNCILHKRPASLATDTSKTEDVVLDVIDIAKRKKLNFSEIILLQPTCPLRLTQDIEKAWNIFSENGRRHTVVSVTALEHPSAWSGTVKDNIFNINHRKLTRSQDYEKEVRLNGSIYVFNVLNFVNTQNIYTGETLAYEMPRERSVDIDDEYDFEMARFLMRRNIQKILI